jgi:acyl-coenzyme A thioesterase PaaI-like protein
MVSRWWNRNYVGTHFGGSLYSMCDPFFMLILIERLGRDFLVWDKAATIRFRRPGKGTMWARFHLDAAEVERVRARALAEETVEPVYRVRVVDGAGKLVAEVEKVVWVSRKKRPGEAKNEESAEEVD